MLSVSFYDMCSKYLISFRNLSTSQSSKSDTRSDSNIENLPSDGKHITLRMQLAGGGWSGMFWRGDPVSKQKPPNQKNWPKNGSTLRGTPVKAAGGALWLKVILMRYLIFIQISIPLYIIHMSEWREYNYIFYWYWYVSLLYHILLHPCLCLYPRWSVSTVMCNTITSRLFMSYIY